MNWPEYLFDLQKTFNGYSSVISYREHHGFLIHLPWDSPESHFRKNIIFEELDKLGRFDGLLVDVWVDRFEKSLIIDQPKLIQYNTESETCITPILLLCLEKIDYLDTLKLLFSICESCGFNDYEINIIAEFMKFFEWYAPIKFYNRFIEINLFIQDDFYVQSELVDQYIHIVNKLFSWSPSRRQLEIDILQSKKIWFGDMRYK